MYKIFTHLKFLNGFIIFFQTLKTLSLIKNTLYKTECLRTQKKNAAMNYFLGYIRFGKVPKVYL